jgi:hypothetical protein
MTSPGNGVVETYGLLVFDTTSRALKAERELKSAGVACAVVPTPVEYTAGCGIALLVRDEEVASARRTLEGSTGHRWNYPYEKRRS